MVWHVDKTLRRQIPLPKVSFLQALLEALQITKHLKTLTWSPCQSE